MDSQGRIVIPEDVRKELGLNEGNSIRLVVEKRGAHGSPSVVLTKSIRPDEFIQRAEGVLKRESHLKASDPLWLKKSGPGLDLHRLEPPR